MESGGGLNLRRSPEKTSLTNRLSDVMVRTMKWTSGAYNDRSFLSPGGTFIIRALS